MKITFKDGRSIEQGITSVSISNIKKNEGYIPVVNIQFEDSMRIYGFKVMYGADDALFLSNPAVIRNNEYYDVAYPSDADFKNHILENP